MSQEKLSDTLGGISLYKSSKINLHQLVAKTDGPVVRIMDQMIFLIVC